MSLFMYITFHVTGIIIGIFLTKTMEKPYCDRCRKMHILQSLIGESEAKKAVRVKK